MNTDKFSNLDNWVDFALCEEIEATCNHWTDVSEIGIAALDAEKGSPVDDVISSVCASVNVITIRNIANMMGIDCEKLEDDLDIFLGY